MELVLATVALEQRLIDNRVFVALFKMAMVTSMISRPLMNWLNQTGMSIFIAVGRGRAMALFEI